jgi:20S proteasome subunit beta 7
LCNAINIFFIFRIDDVCLDDKNQLKPKSLFNWLTRVLYNKRSKFEPLWLDLVIGGMEDGVPFLGHVNFRGRAYTADVVSTGYGGHLAIPLLREYSENPKKAHMTRAQANELVSFRCFSSGKQFLNS